MEKAQTKTRDIRFFSKKNDAMVTVHSPRARKYAGILEAREDIVSYECCVALESKANIHVSRAGIRKGYFETPWSTDFIIHYIDGRFGVREMVTAENLMKAAVLEKLEFSRRYWIQQGVLDWKILILSGPEV